MSSKQVIYAELDALLDTRIATVDYMNPDAAEKLLNTLYWDRIHDDLGELVKDIDSAKFRDIYAKREKTILKRARPTPALILLKDIVMQLEKSMIDTPHTTEVLLEINIFPYVFTDDEKHILTLSIAAYTGSMTKIEIVDIPYVDMTYGFIRNRWSVMVMYNLVEWLKSQENRVTESDRAPQVTLYAPSLYFSHADLPKDEDSVTIEKMGMSPFQALKYIMAEFIGLEMLDVSMFTIIPINAQTAEEVEQSNHEYASSRTEPVPDGHPGTDTGTGSDTGNTDVGREPAGGNEASGSADGGISFVDF